MKMFLNPLVDLFRMISNASRWSASCFIIQRVEEYALPLSAKKRQLHSFPSRKCSGLWHGLWLPRSRLERKRVRNNPILLQLMVWSNRVEGDQELSGPLTCLRSWSGKVLEAARNQRYLQNEVSKRW